MSTTQTTSTTTTTNTPSRRIFLTGGNGYIGTSIIKAALPQGYSIVSLSRTETSDTKLRALGAVPVRGDLASLDVLGRESAAADIVIHLADAFGGSNFSLPYDEVLRIDAAAVKAMATPLQGTDKPLVTTSGTLLAASDPNGGETAEDAPVDEERMKATNRAEAERYALGWTAKGVRVIIIRLAPFVYGLGGSGIALFMKMQFPAGAMTYVVPPDQEAKLTSTVHVDDAASLYLLAAQKAKPGDIFNGVSSTSSTIRQILETSAKTLQVPLADISFDDAVAKLGHFFATFLISDNRASGAKAKKELGWEPKEIGVLEDIANGSYVAVAGEIRKTAA